MPALEQGAWIHHYPESLAVLCNDSTAWHCYSESGETKLEGGQSLYSCRWNKHLLSHYSYFDH